VRKEEGLAKAARVVDKIIDSLSDNQGREINDLTKITGLGVNKMNILLDFLEKFDFIYIDPQDGKVKLTELLMKTIAPRRAFKKITRLNRPLESLV
jgi:DNA-binding IclR family transcriptional regulator